MPSRPNRRERLGHSQFLIAIARSMPRRQHSGRTGLWGMRLYRAQPMNETFRDQQSTRPSLFQSAPLTEARGDLAASAAVATPARFQSAPLTEARGDSSTAYRRLTPTRFQSAPLTEARGDSDQSAGCPSPVHVSIRSPHRSKGRHLQLQAHGFAAVVSIRSPHRSKGRLPLADYDKSKG